MIEPRLMTINELCRYLSVQRDTLRKMVVSGRLPKPVQVSTGERGQRFDRVKVDNYIDRGILDA